MTRMYCAACAALLLLCLASCRSDAPPPSTSPEEFEGVVTYTSHVTAKSAYVDEAQLNALYGDTLTWTYREGSSRWRYDGTGVQDVLHRAGADTQYTRRAGIDTLFTLDVREEARTLDSLYATGATRTILGRSCAEWVVQIKRTRHTYCVDEQLPIDADRYRDYRHGFQAERYAAAPGVYLAYRYESPVFVIEREALAVTEGAVPDEAFAVPTLPRKPMRR